MESVGGPQWASGGEIGVADVDDEEGWFLGRRADCGLKMRSLKPSNCLADRWVGPGF